MKKMYPVKKMYPEMAQDGLTSANLQAGLVVVHSQSTKWGKEG